MGSVPWDGAGAVPRNAAAVIGFSIFYASSGVVLVRRIVHGRISEGHNDLPVPIFQTAGTIYAVLLAFSVIAVWQSYGAARENEAEEASTLATLYRQTNGLPSQPQRCSTSTATFAAPSGSRRCA